MVLATGGIGKSFVVTSNSWEYTGDGHALALLAGANLINMEFIQFHPTGMVWPPSVQGILVTESVRGDGGVLTNSEGRRFMFDYIPDVFKDKYATTEEEGDRWYTDQANNRRPPELLPRDEVARAINAEVKAGRGSPQGGVFLDVSSRLPAAEIIKRLPSMHHQFKELADVDITAEPMQVGPTCHYVMGGVEVDADTARGLGAGPVRGRRGLRRHARLQPPGRQLPLAFPDRERDIVHGTHGAAGLAYAVEFERSRHPGFPRRPSLRPDAAGARDDSWMNIPFLRKHDSALARFGCLAIRWSNPEKRTSGARAARSATCFVDALAHRNGPRQAGPGYGPIKRIPFWVER